MSIAPHTQTMKVTKLRHHRAPGAKGASRRPAKHTRKSTSTKNRQAVENLDLSLENVHQLMQAHQPEKDRGVLDSKLMREDLAVDEHAKREKTRADTELAGQMELLTEMGLGGETREKRESGSKQ